jgi:hypothetical protein
LAAAGPGVVGVGVGPQNAERRSQVIERLAARLLDGEQRCPRSVGVRVEEVGTDAGLRRDAGEAVGDRVQGARDA